jgi:hypothetical protein
MLTSANYVPAGREWHLLYQFFQWVMEFDVRRFNTRGGTGWHQNDLVTADLVLLPGSWEDDVNLT